MLEENVGYFTDGNLNAFCWNKNFYVSIQLSLACLPIGPIDNDLSLVQVNTGTNDEIFSLTHISVTWFQCVQMVNQDIGPKSDNLPLAY